MIAVFVVVALIVLLLAASMHAASNSDLAQNQQDRDTQKTRRDFVVEVTTSSYHFGAIQVESEEGRNIYDVNFTSDEQVFRFTYRCDGKPVEDSALTPYKGTNTLSAILTVATRS